MEKKVENKLDNSAFRVEAWFIKEDACRWERGFFYFLVTGNKLICFSEGV